MSLKNKLLELSKHDDFVVHNQGTSFAFNYHRYSVLYNLALEISKQNNLGIPTFLETNKKI